VSVFKTFVHDGGASEVMAKINDKIVKEGRTNLFVTLSYLVFDTSEMTLKLY